MVCRIFFVEKDDNNALGALSFANPQRPSSRRKACSAAW